MTYNQIISGITALLESHPRIQAAKNVNPLDWINRNSEPDLPVCCFDIIDGTYKKGGEQVWSIQFFFLDQSGPDGEYETEVISDQWMIAEDIIEKLRVPPYSVDDETIIRAVSEKYENFLSGVTFTTNITTYSIPECV